jgi:hypothetical protein
MDWRGLLGGEELSGHAIGYIEGRLRHGAWNERIYMDVTSFISLDFSGPMKKDTLVRT